MIFLGPDNLLRHMKDEIDRVIAARVIRAKPR